MKKPGLKTDFLQVLHLDSLKDYLMNVTSSEVAVRWSFVGGLFAGLFTGLYAM